jgi:hypothetical protein
LDDHKKSWACLLEQGKVIRLPNPQDIPSDGGKHCPHHFLRYTPTRRLAGIEDTKVDVIQFNSNMFSQL